MQFPRNPALLPDFFYLPQCTSPESLNCSRTFFNFCTALPP
jgi:hypothetical protein